MGVLKLAEGRCPLIGAVRFSSLARGLKFNECQGCVGGDSGYAAEYVNIGGSLLYDQRVAQARFKFGCRNNVSGIIVGEIQTTLIRAPAMWTTLLPKQSKARTKIRSSRSLSGIRVLPGIGSQATARLVAESTAAVVAETPF